MLLLEVAEYGLS